MYINKVFLFPTVIKNIRYEKLFVFHTSSPSLVAVLQKEWLFFIQKLHFYKFVLNSYFGPYLVHL